MNEPKTETILEEAARVVDGPRQVAYGPPRVNHGRTALMWSAYLGIEVTARDVCMLNVLQKASRDSNMPKRDNLTDIAGYARNAEIVEAQEAVDGPWRPAREGDPVAVPQSAAGPAS